MLTFLKNVFPSEEDNKWNYHEILLTLVVITIPTKHLFCSIALILFTFFAFRHGIKHRSFTFQPVLVLPILFYLLMGVSLIWTTTPSLTLSGLQKELPFLLVPFAFMLGPSLSRESLYRILRNYSWFMVGYALVFLIRAVLRFLISKDSSVFFYHNLVTDELNAIYISIFSSLALMYFVAQKSKSALVNAAFIVLFVFVVMLSSKSIITIDVILIIAYYAFFAAVPKSTKTVTIVSVITFVVCSFVFVKQVRERFLIEYETAFVDNTLNTKIGNGNVYNVSLHQAWTQQKFKENHFFPGTALRVFQVRIFKEMVNEQPVFWTGFGLEASQDQIKAKIKEHGLYGNYGDFNYHNQYVQSFSDLGILGFFVVVFLVIWNAKNAFISKDFLHIAFSITMIILFLSESFFCRQRGIVFFIVLYCLFHCAEVKTSKQ